MQELWQKQLIERGWSGRDLAEKSGLSTNFVRRLVNGRLAPGRVALQALCAAVGLDFVEVYKALKYEQYRRHTGLDSVTVELTPVPGAPMLTSDSDLRTALQQQLHTATAALSVEQMFDLLRYVWSMSTMSEHPQKAF